MKLGSDLWRSLRTSIGRSRSSGVLVSLRSPGVASEATGAPRPAAIGPFRIEARLGWGATSQVYRAQRAGTNGAPDGPPVALKVFSGGWLASALDRARFVNEARALARLEHPGIPRLVESDWIETETESIPYVATALVLGRTLRAALVDGPFDRARALGLVDRLAEILEYAHDRGVVHRDLKPENIVLDHEDRPHVLDFGIALLTRLDPGMTTMGTRVGQVMGTPAYLSPEQALAGPEPVDRRSDLYSLGVIAFELLSGRLPYDVASGAAHHLVLAAAMAEPRLLGDVAPACRGDVERIVHRLLAKRPTDRYAAAAELRDDLARHRAGRPIRARRVPDPRKKRRLRVATRIAAAGAVAASVAAVTWALRQNTADTPARRAARESEEVGRAARDVVAAQTIVHGGEPRTPESTARALALLAAAHERLQEASDGAGYGPLTLHVLWRKAEAHLILAGLHWDVEELRRAKTTLGQAWAYGEPPITPPIDPARYPRLFETAYAEIATHMAGTEVALAELETPLLHAELAVQDVRHGPRWTWESYRAAPEGSELAGARFRFHCLTLHTSAGAYRLRGRLLGNRADLDTALAHAGRGVRLWNAPSIPGPKGAMLHTLGEIWTERALLTEQAADRDSARAALARALGIRTAMASPAAFRVTHAALGRLALAEAAANAEPGRRQAILAEALEGFRTALRRAPNALDAKRDAHDRLVEAELATELAAAGGDPGARIDAREDVPAPADPDTLLARAVRLLPAERYPLQHAEALRIRARRHEWRWRTTGDPAERRRATADLRFAAELVTAEEDPRRHAALQARLAGIEPTTATREQRSSD